MLYFAKPVLIIAAALGTALFVGRNFIEPTPETKVLPATVPSDAAGPAHYRGAATAPVTLLMYGDYQCPPCARYNVIVNDVLARYGGKVRLEYRHFPLLPVHPNATPAAVAAEAAGEQGQYWKMHDLLLESQERWARSAEPEKEFTAMAASIGLDQDRFRQAFGSAELRERVEKDAASGRALGVVATPTFFINGRRVELTPQPSDNFFKLIDAQLQGK